MYQEIKKNWYKNRHLTISGFFIVFLILLLVAYNYSNENLAKKTDNTKNSIESSDLKTFQEFIFNQINSPFVNVDYKIKKGDTIQKILKKYKVQNNEIQQL